MNYIVEQGRRSLPEASWRPVFQRSIDAFQQDAIEEGAAACRTLLNAFGLPDPIRERTYQNQFWYAQPIQDVVPGTSVQPLAVTPVAGWTLGEPSPAATGDGLAVVLRATHDRRAVESPAHSWPSRRRADGMDLIILGETFHNGCHLAELLPFAVDGGLYVAAIVAEPGQREVLHGGLMILAGREASQLRLFGPRPGNFRQGWSPVLTVDGPSYVAWWEPTEVYRFGAESGAFERVAMRMAPRLAERFQRGTQGVPAPGGYLFLVNEAITLPNAMAVNLSRFVRIDEGFQITDVSPQFFMTERGRDIATGLARQDDRLIAGFMAGGKTPLLATMGVDEVMAALIPVDAPGPA
ncbi:MAG: hypothetical protein ACRDJC_15220 [Thermomicrobiales bacterium]